MATLPVNLISLDEYLHTSYRPDCDFVDGEVQERNMGEFDHNRIQLLLASWFLANERSWGVVCAIEQRTRVAGERVRVPDVCLVSASSPREQVTVTPPLLCIEVLSPEDRLPRMIRRMEDFRNMGVEHLWIIDPADRVAYRMIGEDVLTFSGTRLEIPGTPIFVDLASLFANLD